MDAGIDGGLDNDHGRPSVRTSRALRKAVTKLESIFPFSGLDGFRLID